MMQNNIISGLNDLHFSLSTIANFHNRDINVILSIEIT